MIQLSSATSDVSELDGGVFSTEDIFMGLIIGILLALVTSFLQGRRSQNDFVLWTKEPEDNITKLPFTTAVSSSTDKLELEFATNSTALPESSILNDDLPMQKSRSTVFDGNGWKEMSRAENYVFYKRNLNQKKKKKKKSLEGDAEQTHEQRVIVIALLALFIPIFSVEFFFALSRQILCGAGGYNHGLLSSLDAAQNLCSPVR